MEIKYLSTEEVIEIHNKIIDATGGHKGILSEGNLDFIISQMRIPRNIFGKATILFNGILTNHPFVDGNKRTGLEALKTFLYLNDKKFVANDEDIWVKVHEVSEGKLKFEEIVNWIKEKCD